MRRDCGKQVYLGKLIICSLMLLYIFLVIIWMIIDFFFLANFLSGGFDTAHSAARLESISLYLFFNLIRDIVNYQ